MKITLTQEVEGHAALDTIDVEAARARFLIDNGYATAANVTEPDQDTPVPQPEKALETQDPDKVDQTNATTVPADEDPTLAQNREPADTQAAAQRPGKDARKAEWIAYAEATGQDSSGTVAELKARLT